MLNKLFDFLRFKVGLIWLTGLIEYNWVVLNSFEDKPFDCVLEDDFDQFWYSYEDDLNLVFWKIT